MECMQCRDSGYLTSESEGEFAIARPCPCRTPCPECSGSGLVVHIGSGAAVSRPCSCRNLRVRIRLFNEARLPSEYHSKRLEPFEELHSSQSLAVLHLTRYRQAYVPKSRGLLLWGPPGRGKTHMICALVRYLTLERGIRARFVDFFDLCNEIRLCYAAGRSIEDLILPLIETDVLAIDELGKGRGRDLEDTVLDQIVCRRYNSGRTLVATTNFDASGTAPVPGVEDKNLLSVRVGDRVFSRLQEMCDFLLISGPDHRLPKKLG